MIIPEIEKAQVLKIHGLDTSVIMRNTFEIDNPYNHYFDNFFTNCELMKTLSDGNISPIGTVR